MLESKVDEKICNYAKRLGWFPIKLTMLGRYGVAGIPDRMFLRTGRVFFIEMKATGKTSSPLQKKRQEMLRDLCFDVYECDDPEKGYGIIDRQSCL